MGVQGIDTQTQLPRPLLLSCRVRLPCVGKVYTRAQAEPGPTRLLPNHLNAHTEPLFIRNKILKLGDLYQFELSKFMFDCINGKLPTPILEFFITNATIHAHHTRQRNVPHVTQTFGTISERAVTHKGPTTWTEIPQTIRLHQHKNIFSRLLKHDYITKYN